ncbi:glycosyltransferase family 9 protein [Pedobacter sp. SYP-B3415]|uniref:glycosyltransferase family 9 protein n=1 Tax=Pedobacter sp. SYP-B3415 TaxID=2496641 RepID=UPI00101C4913|nr:glycosyltransferase family 9 protein [Pedobacter sp. SYP-B3415]
MQQPATIVILRFSAMGDVAMVASVLREFYRQHPETKLVMVSRPAFAPFFADNPGVQFHALKPNDLHKGIGGLQKLAAELRNYKPGAVADLHDNIRSRTVSLLLRLSGIRIARIDKGRREKKALTRRKNKKLVPLKHTTERYADVFRKLGLDIQLSHALQPHRQTLPGGFETSQKAKLIGIAPFAQHSFKIYPTEKMTEVISGLNQAGYRLVIFGGGASEKRQAQIWAENYAGVDNTIGRFTLSEELAIISNLDLMLSMDSSGMHMASLCGIPVLSVWGPTHPYAGFLGYGQNFEDCIQPEHPARPNSIYGNRPCYCGDIPCIELITPGEIIARVQQKLES